MWTIASWGKKECCVYAVANNDIITKDTCGGVAGVSAGTSEGPCLYAMLRIWTSLGKSWHPCEEEWHGQF